VPHRLIALGDGALSAGTTARNLAGPRWMVRCLSSRDRAGTKQVLGGEFRTKEPCDYSGTSEGSARFVAYAPPSVPSAEHFPR
jgi:hypothetical protein